MTHVLWSDLRPRLARYLPPSLFNRLRNLPHELEQLPPAELHEASDLLLEVTRTLNPLHRVLVDYMPRYLLELDPTPNQPHGEMLEGTFIFADVSGFTALTEMLARQGDAKGREVMNQIMNRLFSSVLDPITASGGDMLIFVGDAAMVYFPKDAHNNDVSQAIRAALRMQRAIVPFKHMETEFGPCSLTMSIGVERGVAYAAVVGTTQRMELLISGPGTYRAMQAEVIAESGQVLLGEEAAKIAEAHFTLEGALVVDDWGDRLGDYEIITPTRRRGSSTHFGLALGEILETLQTNLARIERLAPFLPEDMLALLVNTDRRRKLQSEFRPVAVQFINVIGVEELALSHGPKVATQVFQSYFNKAKTIIEQNEGIISQIDAYISGFFFLNTFGVPKSHEGTTRYAVAAALQLSQALEHINQQYQLNPPLRQRGGITYGLTFNGEIGSNYRRESVIAGPAVNRAARLMSKAEAGQIILDSEIWENTRNAFVGEELPAVHLKGIDGPVVIVNVRDIRLGTRLEPLKRPLLERMTEKVQLEKALRAVKSKRQSSAWMIDGHTGIGKTSLLASLAETAKRQGVTLLVGYCQPHGKHAPLFAWRDLLVGWLELDFRHTADEQISQMKHKLGALGLAAFAKDIADLFSLPDLESESSELNLTGPHLILALLQQLATQQPTLVVLEDTHWLDSESYNVLGQLLAKLAEWPLMMVLTGHDLLPHDGLTHLTLPPLSESALVEVAQRALGADTLDKSLADWVCQHGAGNPLYVEELCRALQQSQAIILDKATGETHWTGIIPSLPLSLHELLLSRLDGLPLAPQELLKRGSILGFSFEAALILKLIESHLTPTEIDEALDAVITASFLTELADATYRFSHPLMQEAIYATLSFQQRQDWHKKVADGLAHSEATSAVQLEKIVYHYSRSSDVAQAAKFGLLAGDKAREQQSFAGALDYYRQVYSLIGASVESRMKAAENQGDVLALQRDYLAAASIYPQAAELGSPTALAKQAILAGDLGLLTHVVATAQLQPWVDGARAWLLAATGEHETALKMAQTALAQADGAAHSALSTVVQNLENQRALEDYDGWRQRFINAVIQLGMSTIDLLDMSPDHALVVNRLTRNRSMKLADIVAELQKPIEHVQTILNELTEKGHVKVVTINQEIWYKAQFARKAKKKLSSDVWSALDF